MFKSSGLRSSVGKEWNKVRSKRIEAETGVEYVGNDGTMGSPLCRTDNIAQLISRRASAKLCTNIEI